MIGVQMFVHTVVKVGASLVIRGSRFTAHWPLLAN